MTINTFNKITYYFFHVTVMRMSVYLHYGNAICHEMNENNGPKIKQIYTFHLFRIYLF